MSTTVSDKIASDRTVEIFGNNDFQIPDELSILDGNSAPAKHGMFRIMSRKDGDKRVVWDHMSIMEINAAQKMFNNLVAQGMVPYLVGTSQVMKTFDPHAGEVLFMPMTAIAGG